MKVVRNKHEHVKCLLRWSRRLGIDVRIKIEEYHKIWSYSGTRGNKIQIVHMLNILLYFSRNLY